MTHSHLATAFPDPAFAPLAQALGDAEARRDYDQQRRYGGGSGRSSGYSHASHHQQQQRGFNSGGYRYFTSHAEFMRYQQEQYYRQQQAQYDAYYQASPYDTVVYQCLA